MTWFSRNQEETIPPGYGKADLRLARQLASAVSPEDADAIAVAGGFENAEDALTWLRDRTPEE